MMEEYHMLDNVNAENAALRRKLQSKAEALLILSKDLDDCRKERDQFQLMAEQLQMRYTALKKRCNNVGAGSTSMLLSSGDCMTLEERNKALRLEVEDLRQQLRDANADIKALKTQLNLQKCNGTASLKRTDSLNFFTQQKEEMVQQLEGMHIKSSQLSRDLQSLLDEKEELVVQRDALKCKVHRMNYELHRALAPPGYKEGAGDAKIDIDSLVTENTYLHDRLQQLEQEKESMNQSILKLKSMLDKKRSKGAIKLGSTNNTSGMVISHKQVQQLLQRGSDMPTTAAALSDMRSLCLALLEALSDKGIALTHQKKTNRILGRRIAELEHRLGSEGATPFPSRALLSGYFPAEVDKEVDQILAQVELDQHPSQQGCSNEVTVNGQESLDEQEDDPLPPELQQMVIEALEELKRESQRKDMERPITSPVVTSK